MILVRIAMNSFVHGPGIYPDDSNILDVLKNAGLTKIIKCPVRGTLAKVNEMPRDMPVFGIFWETV